MLKELYKETLGRTAVDTVVRRTYARLFKNDVLRVIYYREMEAIFDRVLQRDSVAVDVGCHEGNVLESILRRAPAGKHHAFEPIPHLARALAARFPTVHVHGQALSDREGRAIFHHVPDCNSHSGLRRRDYPEGVDTVEEIEVQTIPLDRVLDPSIRVALLKVDVEGAEREVLRGARETLRRHRPVTVFQHGRGSAEFYDTTPEQIFDLFREAEMEVSLMGDWLRGKPALTRDGFHRQFHRRLNYIFVAHAPRGSAL